jgi:hypothetical protein
MSAILYYSNFCQHSKALLQNVGRSPEISKDVHFICIDKRVKKGDGKTYVVLENGQQIIMPENVSKVPALLLLNDNYRVIYGEEIASYFKPRQQEVTKMVTQNNMEPEAFAIGGGGGYGAMSDSYSFLDMGPDELSAKGTGGTRQMHNFVPLNHADQIHTPQDDTDYKSSKISDSLTVEQLMQQREQEFAANTQGQQRM